MSLRASWRWVWMTALIAGAIGSYGILNQERDHRPATDDRAELPGHYLKDAVLTVTHPDGTPRLRLVAEEIRENVADGGYMARSVNADYAVPNAAAWTLRSDRADVPPGLATVGFQGNVEVRGADTGRRAVIRTDVLELDTVRNVVRTPASVEVEFAGQRLTATGLTADLRDERLQLESEVHGSFLAP